MAQRSAIGSLFDALIHVTTELESLAGYLRKEIFQGLGEYADLADEREDNPWRNYLPPLGVLQEAKRKLPSAHERDARHALERSVRTIGRDGVEGRKSPPWLARVDTYWESWRDLNGSIGAAHKALTAAAPELDAGIVNLLDRHSSKISKSLLAAERSTRLWTCCGWHPLSFPQDSPIQMLAASRRLEEWYERLRPLAGISEAVVVNRAAPMEEAVQRFAQLLTRCRKVDRLVESLAQIRQGLRGDPPENDQPGELPEDISDYAGLERYKKERRETLRAESETRYLLMRGWLRFYDARDDVTLAVRMWRHALDDARTILPAVHPWMDDPSVPPLRRWTADMQGELNSLGGLIDRLLVGDSTIDLNRAEFGRLTKAVAARLSELKRIPNIPSAAGVTSFTTVPQRPSKSRGKPARSRAKGAGRGRRTASGQEAKRSRTSSRKASKPKKRGPIRGVSELRRRTPPDAQLISIAVALSKFSVARITLLRAVKDGRLTDYRKSLHPKNAPLILAEGQVAGLWPRRKTG